MMAHSKRSPGPLAPFSLASLRSIFVAQEPNSSTSQTVQETPLLVLSIPAPYLIIHRKPAEFPAVVDSAVS